MDAKYAIARLQTDLTALRDSGQKAVPIDALQSYVSRLQLEPEASLEEKQLDLQRTLAHYEATNQFNFELFRSANEAGREALNASLLINGGAVVAILSFLGAVVNKATASTLGVGLSAPLLAFGSGVLLSALSFGVRYLSNLAQNLERRDHAIKVNAVAIVLAASAYVAFSVGVYWAYVAFGTYFASAH